LVYLFESISGDYKMLDQNHKMTFIDIPVKINNKVSFSKQERKKSGASR